MLVVEKSGLDCMFATRRLFHSCAVLCRKPAAMADFERMKTLFDSIGIAKSQEFAKNASVGPRLETLILTVSKVT